MSSAPRSHHRTPRVRPAIVDGNLRRAGSRTGNRHRRVPAQTVSVSSMKAVALTQLWPHPERLEKRTDSPIRGSAHRRDTEKPDAVESPANERDGCPGPRPAHQRRCSARGPLTHPGDRGPRHATGAIRGGPPPAHRGDGSSWWPSIGIDHPLPAREKPLCHRTLHRAQDHRGRCCDKTSSRSAVSTEAVRVGYRRPGPALVVDGEVKGAEPGPSSMASALGRPFAGQVPHHLGTRRHGSSPTMTVCGNSPMVLVLLGTLADPGCAVDIRRRRGVGSDWVQGTLPCDRCEHPARRHRLNSFVTITGRDQRGPRSNETCRLSTNHRRTSTNWPSMGELISGGPTRRGNPDNWRIRPAAGDGPPTL